VVSGHPDHRHQPGGECGRGHRDRQRSGWIRQPEQRFTYVPAPTVTGIAPAFGPTAGGTTVTITGTNFTGAGAVNFAGTGATTYTVVSATQITATSPAGSAGPVNVTVVTSGGTSATSVLTSSPMSRRPRSPASPPTRARRRRHSGHHHRHQLLGTTGAGAVTFGANNATAYTVVSATQITATSPAGSAGAVTVTVNAPGGSGSQSNAFTYVPAPTVTGIAPAFGPTAGGTTVTITGTNFTGPVRSTSPGPVPRPTPWSRPPRSPPPARRGVPVRST